MQKEVKKEALKKVVDREKENRTSIRPELKDKGKIVGTVLWDNCEPSKLKENLKK